MNISLRHVSNLFLADTDLDLAHCFLERLRFHCQETRAQLGITSWTIIVWGNSPPSGQTKKFNGVRLYGPRQFSQPRACFGQKAPVALDVIIASRIGWWTVIVKGSHLSLLKEMLERIALAFDEKMGSDESLVHHWRVFSGCAPAVLRFSFPPFFQGRELSPSRPLWKSVDWCALV